MRRRLRYRCRDPPRLAQWFAALGALRSKSQMIHQKKGKVMHMPFTLVAPCGKANIEQPKGTTMKPFKKLFTGALAALGFAAVAATFATPAQAAITCSQYLPGGNWPNGIFTQYCGSASQSNAQYLPKGLQGDGGPGIQKLNSTMTQVNSADKPNHRRGVFYLFYDQSEFLIWASTNLASTDVPTASELNGAAGYTRFQVTPTFTPLYTVIFQHIDSVGGGAGKDVPVGDLQEVVGHEAGHWMDAILSYLKPPTNPNLYPFLSNSVWFQNLLATDIKNLDAITAQCVTNSKGLFNSYQQSWLSYTTPVFMCTGSNGSGGTLIKSYQGFKNSQILSFAWPEFFTNSSKRPQAEQFAEFYALLNGYNDQASFPSSFLGFWDGQNRALPQANLFQCSTAFETYVYQHVQLPTSLPAGCPMQ
ncbi:MAG: hypothetical protein JST44_24320 [Cyanobacteria bacterium SZAS LIN-5]|nr:hypothetical protein [Cyanobacteria bacterium SZAS LIN-5]